MSIHDVALLLIGIGAGGFAAVFPAFRAGYERHADEIARFHRRRT